MKSNKINHFLKCCKIGVVAMPSSLQILFMLSFIYVFNSVWFTIYILITEGNYFSSSVYMLSASLVLLFFIRYWLKWYHNNFNSIIYPKIMTNKIYDFFSEYVGLEQQAVLEKNRSQILLKANDKDLLREVDRKMHSTKSVPFLKKFKYELYRKPFFPSTYTLEYKTEDSLSFLQFLCAFFENLEVDEMLEADYNTLGITYTLPLVYGKKHTYGGTIVINRFTEEGKKKHHFLLEFQIYAA